MRKTATKLSDTVYNSEKLDGLFRTFEADASLVLLFLKSVECVDLLERNSKNKEPNLRFRVCIAEECRASVKEKRKQFMQQIDPSYWRDTPLAVMYPVSIETSKFTSNRLSEKKITRWLVNEYYAGGQVSTHLKMLQQDPKLSYIPLVGTAMSMDPVSAASKKPPEQPADVDNEVKPAGQVFCFLPMPIEQSSATGLPVHVNGYFAISQNRRHLKWPTAGQKVASDKSLLWNQCLLTELVPQSYVYLLLHAISLSRPHSPHHVTPELIYAAFPNLVVVDEKWQIVLQSMYKYLFHKAIFHTPNKGGSWVRIEESVFNCIHEDKFTEEIVCNLLLKCQINVVTVPMHILHALGAFSQHSPEIISPGLVRTTIRPLANSYQAFSRENKIKLLQYLIKDEDFSDLAG